MPIALCVLVSLALAPAPPLHVSHLCMVIQMFHHMAQYTDTVHGDIGGLTTNLPNKLAVAVAILQCNIPKNNNLAPTSRILSVRTH